MPQENAQVAGEAVAALNETYRTGDMGPWRRHVEKWADPELVLEAPTDAFIEGEWRGHDGAVGFVANQMEALDGMWLRMDELVEMRPCHLFRMRDGRIRQWQIFRTRGQALDAARGG